VAEHDPDLTPPLTLIDHLEELRRRLLRSLVAVAIGMAGGWFASPYVLDWLIRVTVRHAVVLSPVEALFERFKLSLLLGACFALPAIFYQVWAFVVPGLLHRERKLLLPLVAGSMALFAAGIAIAMWLVVPIAIAALDVFLTPSMTAQFRLHDVLAFVYGLCLATGMVFQLPLVVGALTALRVVSTRFLIRQWRLALVGAVVVSALITPGDVVIAQLLLGVPLVVLYALSVIVAWAIERSRGDEGREPALLDQWTEETPGERA
jgi:sec-independent protein translocase protein TatC